RLLREVVATTMFKPTQLWPTHCNRNAHIFEETKTWAKDGPVDITASSWAYYQDEEIKPSTAVKGLLDAGVPLAHITMTSDACGSLPQFDAQGRLVKIDTARPMALLQELGDLVRLEGLPLDQALRTVTANVADVLKLPRKGRITVGHDADLLVLDADLRPRHVIAGGVMCMRDSIVVKKGTFED
ncbi:MAG: beta-aspartyl-peptidase, partial [Proteobacteria bacterium]|nr:beta-aspartyl-peptidase [Pseudomonadota bacterium]